MNRWKKVTIGQLCEVNRESIRATDVDTEILYLDTGSITEGRIESYQTVSIKKAPSRARRIVRENDIVYSTVRPNQKHYGILQNVATNTIVSTGFTTLSCKSEVVPKFIYYWLTQKWVTEQLHSIAEGSVTTYPSIKPSDIASIELDLPPYNEQQAIAEVLSSLDDKIELLHRNNKTLEEMADSLFQKWFVDDVDVQSEHVTLNKLCARITKGTTPTTLGKSFTEEGINFVKVESMTESGGFIRSKFAFIDNETNDLLQRSKLQLGDVLFTIAGTIGRTALVPRYILPANTNQAVAILRANPELISSCFLKYVMRSKYISEIMETKIVHAVQPNLSLGEIANTQIPLPSSDKLEIFDHIAGDIQAKLDINDEQIETITVLRDKLLPRLMSGDVRVKTLTNELSVL